MRPLEAPRGETAPVRRHVQRLSFSLRLYRATSTSALAFADTHTPPPSPSASAAPSTPDNGSRHGARVGRRRVRGDPAAPAGPRACTRRRSRDPPSSLRAPCLHDVRKPRGSPSSVEGRGVARHCPWCLYGKQSPKLIEISTYIVVLGCAVSRETARRPGYTIRAHVGRWVIRVPTARSAYGCVRIIRCMRMRSAPCTETGGSDCVGVQRPGSTAVGARVSLSAGACTW